MPSNVNQLSPGAMRHVGVLVINALASLEHQAQVASQEVSCLIQESFLDLEAKYIVGPYDDDGGPDFYPDIGQLQREWDALPFDEQCDYQERFDEACMDGSCDPSDWYFYRVLMRKHLHNYVGD